MFLESVKKTLGVLLLGLTLASAARAAAMELLPGVFIDQTTGSPTYLADGRGERWPGVAVLFEVEDASGAVREIHTPDRVIRIGEILEDNRREVFCQNSSLPGVRIVKRYHLDARDNSLLFEVEFTGPDADLILRWFAVLDRGGEFAPDGEDEAFQDGSLFANTRTFALRRKGSNRTLLLYREKIDGETAPHWRPLPTPEKNICKIPMSGNFLKRDRPFSSALRCRLVDEVDFAKVTQLASECWLEFFPPQPEWTRDLLVDVMYFTGKEAEFAQRCAPWPVTGTIWFLNPPWGNWSKDDAPPVGSHPDIPGIGGFFGGAVPNLKLAFYSNGSIDAGSLRMTDAPGWVVRKADGKPLFSGIPSDSGGGESYYLNVADPAVRTAAAKMFAERAKSWSLSFHYTDEPGLFYERPDWRLREMVQSLHHQQYLREVLELQRADNPESAIFSNLCLPYSAINYVEFRDAQWQQALSDRWREISYALLGMRLTRPMRNTTVLTYGKSEAEPAYTAYTVYYGTAANLPADWRMPYAHAAMRTRGAQALGGAVKNPWYDNPGMEFEALAWQSADGAVLVNVLAHADGAAEVILDARKAGLEVGRRYTAELLSAKPCKPGEDNTKRVQTTEYAFFAECPEEVRLHFEMEKMQVNSLKLTLAE